LDISKKSFALVELRGFPSQSSIEKKEERKVEEGRKRSCS